MTLSCLVAFVSKFAFQDQNEAMWKENGARRVYKKRIKLIEEYLVRKNRLSVKTCNLVAVGYD